MLLYPQQGLLLTDPLPADTVPAIDHATFHIASLVALMNGTRELRGCGSQSNERCGMLWTLTVTRATLLSRRMPIEGRPLDDALSCERV